MFIIEELDYILEAIEGHDIDMLISKAKQLKETDGEGWAVGEMLERAIGILNS